MTPHEILRQEFDEIRAGISENIASDKAYEKMSGIGLVPNITIPVIYDATPGPVVIYTHREHQTKTYYDEGCATFKLIRQIQEYIGRDKPERVFWRVEPEVVEHMDFERYRKIYKGYVRFSDRPDG